MLQFVSQMAPLASTLMYDPYVFPRFLQLVVCTPVRSIASAVSDYGSILPLSFCRRPSNFQMWL